MPNANSLTDLDHVDDLRVETITGTDIVWVHLHGQADISTLGDLDAALEQVELDGARCVHLHLNDLDFADVATIRRLTAFARKATRAGHEVTTCGASPMLRKVAHLLRVHEDLGIA
jgi:anti-anti-sigma regulatory factor